MPAWMAGEDSKTWRQGTGSSGSQPGLFGATGMHPLLTWRWVSECRPFTLPTSQSPPWSMLFCSEICSITVTGLLCACVSARTCRGQRGAWKSEFSHRVRARARVCMRVSVLGLNSGPRAWPQHHCLMNHLDGPSVLPVVCLLRQGLALEPGYSPHTPKADLTLTAILLPQPPECRNDEPRPPQWIYKTLPPYTLLSRQDLELKNKWQTKMAVPCAPQTPSQYTQAARPRQCVPRVSLLTPLTTWLGL